MFGIIKEALMLVLISAANLFVSADCLTKCISLKNRECKAREVVVNNEYMTFPYNIKVNKCIGSCNNITNPYSKVCIPDIIKYITVKIFDLISQQNTTKQTKWHESCECVCRLNLIACNNKQKWNEDKCRCECLFDKKCDHDFVWNASNCEFEYRKKQQN